MLFDIVQVQQLVEEEEKQLSQVYEDSFTASYNQLIADGVMKLDVPLKGLLATNIATMIQNIAEKKYVCIVAKQENQVVGVICGELHSPNTVYVAQLAVSPKAQKQGIAKALIHKLFDAYPEHVTEFFGFTRDANIPAKNFYKKAVNATFMLDHGVPEYTPDYVKFSYSRMK